MQCHIKSLFLWHVPWIDKTTVGSRRVQPFHNRTISTTQCLWFMLRDYVTSLPLDASVWINATRRGSVVCSTYFPYSYELLRKNLWASHVQRLQGIHTCGRNTNSWTARSSLTRFESGVVVAGLWNPRRGGHCFPFCLLGLYSHLRWAQHLRPINAMGMFG
jgi:hypothetical protein